MKTIIRVENATKKFKNIKVFSDLNLEIEKGKSYGFVGYNGCGKSVLFKCICGLAKLNKGAIYYQDKLIGKEQDFISDAGVVIEAPEFLNDLSGFKNLKVIANIKKLISDHDINEALKLLGLFEYRDVKVGKYSLGMKQKLRLVQALMEKPQILILDEPMNGLDKSSVEKVRGILKKYIDEGGTLLLTSHNRDDIDILCEKVYEFDDQQLKLEKG
ncbi:ATP-binding cassette domain-containing protein [Anaerosacchariphilus polymeriproducens]|uniref:ATP-binding cassette domain-containing protein n=1 Tax=Anaerosacchariphilus polymeriproducens TaxID=1812858 RepID=A0A371AQL1_9FIRM|nr:ATP-binding cassette domain-containing protein [Anaerosacchariphilus polymeriproducens]RDU21822.1 ATP-binding cassette domain-containing protein [Anaerosacchariphilus polymeriproducens]